MLELVPNQKNSIISLSFKNSSSFKMELKAKIVE